MDKTTKLRISLMPLDDPNPFGRDDTLHEIERCISNYENLILLGARRIGKTSLLNAIRKRKEEGYKIEREYEVIFYDCEEHRKINQFFAKLFVSTTVPKIFVSSIGKKSKGELGEEREVAEKTIKGQGCEPFLIENIVESDNGTKVEEKNIKNSFAFLLILGKEKSDKVIDEYNFAIKYSIPILCLIKGLDDKERDHSIINIIKDLEENERGIYKRYENLGEFKKVLETVIEDKKEEWKKKWIKRSESDSFRDAGDSFFTSIEKQTNRRFLILIDEFGELKRGDKKNFDEFLPYFKTKRAGLKNCTFVITGSENVFMRSYAKYFGEFKRIKIEKFDIKTAKELIINELGWDKQNIFLDKIIEISGTLPKDLVYVISELRDWNEQNFGNNEAKNIIVKII